MGSGLDVLIFIPAALHSSANRSSKSWRSQAHGANRTTSPTKSRDQTLTLVIQGANSPNKGARHTIMPNNTPQDSLRDTVEWLLQIHKTHVDWLGKLPCTLQDPAEGVELVHCPKSRAKTTLLLLNLRFDYPADPSL